MLERHEKLQEKRKQTRTASTGRTMGDCTFMPKISQGIPDFKAIH